MTEYISSVSHGRTVRPSPLADVQALISDTVEGNSAGFVGFSADEVDVLVKAGVSSESANFCRMVAGVEAVDSIIALKDASPELVRVLADYFD